MSRASVSAMTALILLLCVAGCMGEKTEERSPSPLRDYESLEAAVELLGARYPEATDTAVRDQVLVSVYCSVVHGEPVPREFGMFSPAGDRAVRSRVLAFVVPKRNETSGLTEEERIEAVWGESWGEDAYLQPSDCTGL